MNQIPRYLGNAAGLLTNLLSPVSKMVEPHLKEPKRVWGNLSERQRKGVIAAGYAIIAIFWVWYHPLLAIVGALITASSLEYAYEGRKFGEQTFNEIQPNVDFVTFTLLNVLFFLFLWIGIGDYLPITWVFSIKVGMDLALRTFESSNQTSVKDAVKETVQNVSDTIKEGSQNIRDEINKKSD